MKKRNKIIIITITIAIVVASIMYYLYVGRYTETEQLTTYQIKDTLGRTIEDYSNNKMPFIIDIDEKAKATVNGEKYLKDQRIYEPGEYEIKITNGKKAEKTTISIKDIERKKESEYHIYSTVATLPTLFSTMNLMNDLECKGYYWTERTSTIDIEKIQKYCPNLEISKTIDFKFNTEQEKLINREIIHQEMKEYIEETLRKDPDAYFNIHIDELRFYAEFMCLSELGLTDNRYKMYLYTDGTLSYTRDYEISEENKYKKFKSEKEEYENILNQIRGNTYDGTKLSAEYLKNSEFYNEYNYNYLLISTLRDNVEYIIQFPELIKFDDEQIKQEMQKANFNKIIAQDKFKEIEDKNKEVFFDLINFNKKEMDEKYFNQANEGKYLVITGTNPFYGVAEKEKFEDIVKRTCEKYQNEYNILYKPHPSAIPNEEQEAYLTSLNIKILPGRIPMEAITYIYPNLKLGGFASSLYMSIDQGKTLFFYQRNKNFLVDPLNVLYDNLFANAEFIY